MENNFPNWGNYADEVSKERSPARFDTNCIVGRKQA